MIKQAHHQSKEIISKATLQADEEYKKIVDEGKKKAFEIINDASYLVRKRLLFY